MLGRATGLLAGLAAGLLAALALAIGTGLGVGLAEVRALWPALRDSFVGAAARWVADLEAWLAPFAVPL